MQFAWIVGALAASIMVLINILSNGTDPAAETTTLETQAGINNITTTIDSEAMRAITRLSASLRDTQRGVSDLTAENQRLTRELHSVLNTVAALSGAGEARVQPETIAHFASEAAEDQDNANEQRMTELDTVFANEVIDSVWSNDAAHQIEKVLSSSELNGSKVATVDCRSTLCRTEVTHEDPLAREIFEATFPARLGWTDFHGRMQQVEGPAGIGTVVYLSRDGHTLPRSEID
jgi:hypothetical protein